MKFILFGGGLLALLCFCATLALAAVTVQHDQSNPGGRGWFEDVVMGGGGPMRGGVIETCETRSVQALDTNLLAPETWAGGDAASWQEQMDAYDGSKVYRSETGEVVLTATLGNDQANSELNLLLLTLAGKKQRANESRRLPLNVTFVVDKSTSMSGGRLENVRSALLLVADFFEEDDVVSLVGYDSNVTVELKSGKFDKTKFENAVEQMDTSGMTYMEGGLREGFTQLYKNYSEGADNRMILLSDGRANTGISDAEGLGEVVQESLKSLVTVSTIGVGDGYDETIMTTIAKAGSGNYYFMQDPEEAEEIFTTEILAGINTVARDVELLLEVSSDFELSGGIGYRPENLGTGKLKLYPNDLRAEREVSFLLEFRPTSDNVSFESSARTLLQNLQLKYENIDGGNVETNPIQVRFKAGGEDLVHPLLDSEVYKEYVRYLNTEVQAEVYCLLEDTKNTEAGSYLDKLSDQLDRANDRFSGQFDEQITVNRSQKLQIERLETNENINNSLDGRTLQKNNSYRVYEDTYNK